MLSAERNALLTQTGPGTPLGELVRRYWIPALMSSEIAEPDGEPAQVRVLGERLVAFRDSNGTVGLLDEACPHRGCSLWYARNEECGLRCIYHGWKIDAQGHVVDTPNELNTLRVSARSYPVREAGGFVWAYLGPVDRMPPFREFNWMKLPPSHVVITKVHEEANFLQGIEGSIDTSHLGFLHKAFVPGDWGLHQGPSIENPRPKLDIQETAYGFRYAAIRATADGKQNVRVTPFVLPFHTCVPARPGATVLFHAYVPRDDFSNWAYDIRYRIEGPIDMEEHRHRESSLDLNPDFTKAGTYSNKHRQDREAMKTKNFSGIRGVKNQDYAVVESMGPIVDRTKEHLGASDAAITASRRVLLRAIQAVAEGQDAPGTRASVPSDLIVSEDFDIEPSEDWRTASPLPEGMANQEEVALAGRT